MEVTTSTVRERWCLPDVAYQHVSAAHGHMGNWTNYRKQLLRHVFGLYVGYKRGCEASRHACASPSRTSETKGYTGPPTLTCNICLHVKTCLDKHTNTYICRPYLPASKRRCCSEPRQSVETCPDGDGDAVRVLLYFTTRTAYA